MSETLNGNNLDPWRLPEQMHHMGERFRQDAEIQVIWDDEARDTVCGFEIITPLADGGRLESITDTEYRFLSGTHYWGDGNGHTTYHFDELGELVIETTKYEYDYPWQHRVDING